MPRYFFHLHNDVETVDREGMVLPNLGAAKAQAVRAARDVMAGNVRQGRISLGDWIEVEDEQHRQVLAVRFSDCVEIRR